MQTSTAGCGSLPKIPPPGSPLPVTHWTDEVMSPETVPWIMLTLNRV